MARKLPDPPTADSDVDAARVLLHRATIIVRSAGGGAGNHAPQDDAAVDPPPRRRAKAAASGTSRATRRRQHHEIVERHLAALREGFQHLAGVLPPEAFSERGGQPPSIRPSPADGGTSVDLTSEIRRTEWATHGLDTLLQTYADRVPRTAATVGRARDELRAWTLAAQADS